MVAAGRVLVHEGELITCYRVLRLARLHYRRRREP